MAEKEIKRTYDFDTIVDRHNTNCLKYDFAEAIISSSIALIISLIINILIK